MTVYLGETGSIELKRASGAPVRGTIGPADISIPKRRFSFSDRELQGELISGDQVDILTTDQSDLGFIEGHDFPDWRGFVFVDIMGGIRLYDNFESSIKGEIDGAVELAEISSDVTIIIQTRDTRYKHLARCKGFQFTTERESIDLTLLGDQFRKRYEAGLISGQGQLDCFWQHKIDECDPDGCTSNIELPIYLAQLCVRLTQGADFFGRFFIYSPGGTDLRASRNSVWYEAECVVTNVTVNVTPTEIIESSVEFVTTGPIRLLIGEAPSFVLMEGGEAKLLQEDGSGLLLAGSD